MDVKYPQNIEFYNQNKAQPFHLSATQDSKYFSFTCYSFLYFTLKQDGCYRIRIKKFINAYSGKVIKIYQGCGILSRDSLGLDEPYSMKKVVLSLKVINIYHIISFKPLICPPEGKSLEIDSVSQNN